MKERLGFWLALLLCLVACTNGKEALGTPVSLNLSNLTITPTPTEPPPSGVVMVTATARPPQTSVSPTPLPSATPPRAGATPTLAAPLPTPVVLTTTVQYVQAISDINLRNGPGTNYKSIGQVFGGQTALVTGVSADKQWWRVSCPDDTVGDCWVSADAKLTRPATPPTPKPVGPTPTLMPALQTDVKYVQALSNVNIRSGPGNSYAQVGGLVTGQRSLVTGISADRRWWRVVCPDASVGNCWVSADTRFTRPTTAP